MQGGRHRGPAWGFPLQETQAAPALARDGLVPPHSSLDSPSPGHRNAPVPGKTKGLREELSTRFCFCAAPAQSSQSLLCLGSCLAWQCPACSFLHGLAAARTMPFCPTRHLKGSKRLPRGKWVARVKSRLQGHQPRG